MYYVFIYLFVYFKDQKHFKEPFVFWWISFKFNNKQIHFNLFHLRLHLLLLLLLL